jgi:hypothetical protein
MLCKKCFVFIYLMFLFALVQGQTVSALYKTINLPHVGDSIVKQQVDYIDPGIGGTNILWNFQTVKPVNNYYNLKYVALTADSTCFEGVEHSTIYRYKVHKDSLYHTGYENSTTYMNYTKPELKLKFPFKKGDTISSNFVGEGEYCHRINLHVSGKTKVLADASGTLYAPLGLTFKNVLRVKSIREYMQTGVDSVSMYLECYSWYVKDNRYPVFETVKATTKKTGKQEVEYKVASFFYPPQKQVTLLADTTNWHKVYSDEKETNIDLLFLNCSISPNPVESEVKIEYDLNEDATISFTVFDNMGRAKATLPSSSKTAGHYEEMLDLSGYMAGIYPVIVEVNGQTKTYKIIKR